MDCIYSWDGKNLYSDDGSHMAVSGYSTRMISPPGLTPFFGIAVPQ